MIHRLNHRLEVLKRELEAGQRKLRELDREHMQLQNVLLQISGAIQVLEELLAEPEQIPEGDMGSIDGH